MYTEFAFSIQYGEGGATHVSQKPYAVSRFWNVARSGVLNGILYYSDRCGMCECAGTLVDRVSVERGQVWLLENGGVCALVSPLKWDLRVLMLRHLETC